MSNQVVNRNVNIYINDQEAEKSLKNLQAQSDKLTDKIKKGEAAGKDMTAELGRLETVKAKMEVIQQVVDGKMRPSFQMVKNDVARLRRELQSMSEDQPGYAARFDEYKKKTALFDEMKEKISGAKNASKSFADEVKAIFTGVALSNLFQSLLAGIGGYISGMVAGNAKLSDSLSDIEKATNLTAAGAADLNSKLGKIDTRTSNENLREIAIGLGQVGEAADAVNVESIDKIVVALGDEFGGGAKEITTQLSVLRNNLDDIKSGNYGEDIMHLGNAMNVLGANGLATAPVVTDITNRVAGVARTFGVSSGQILGLAATFQELGIETERGSTAYVKILQKIASQPKMFAQVVKDAGMDVGNFYKLVNTDINAAFLKVAEASKKAGNSNAAFGKILNDLGADGAGVSELLSKMASNQKMVQEKTDLATEALKNNSSILSEFDKKNNNLAANLEKLSKNLSSWFANSFLSNMLNSFILSLEKLTAKSKSVTEQFNDQKKTFDSLEKNMAPLITRYDQLKEKAEKLGGVSKLSKEEQVELNKAINAIASSIPTAITQWDEYGNAIAISSGKAKEFMDLQRLMLKEKNKSAIADETEKLNILNEKIASLKSGFQKTMDFKSVRNKYSDEYAKAFGTTPELLASITKAQGEYIKGYTTQLQDLQNSAKATEGIIKELSGDPLVAGTGYGKEGEGKDKPKPVNPNVPDDEALKKARAEAKKLADELAKVRDEMGKLALEMKMDGLPIYEKDLAKINQRYDELKKKLQAAKATKADFARAESLRNQEIEALNERYHNKLLSFFADQDEARAVASMSAHDKEINDLNNLYAEQQKLMRNNTETVLKLHFERLARMREIDKKFAKDEMGNLEDTTEQLIKKPKGPSITKESMVGYKSPKQKKSEQKEENKRLKEYISLAGKAIDLANQLVNIGKMADEAEIARSQKVTDKKIEQYKRQLEQKTMSQEEYDNKTREAQLAQEKHEIEIKKRQFEREKAISIVQAVIGGAQAVISTLAAPPGAADILTLGTIRAIEIGLVAATTIAQIATIASQKGPELESGGFIPDGNSHAQDGIKLVETRTGKIRGEIEGGEPIFSRKFYKNNKGMIDSMMAYSHQTGGSQMKATWMDAPVATINTGKISAQLSNGRKYANGGVLPGGSSGGGGQDMTLYAAFLRRLEALDKKINQPMKAYTVLSENEKQMDRMANIRSSGTIK